MSLRRGLFLCQTTSKEDHPLTTYVTNAKKNKQGKNLKNNLFHFISSLLNSPISITCVFISWKDHLVFPWKSKGPFLSGAVLHLAMTPEIPPPICTFIATHFSSWRVLTKWDNSGRRISQRTRCSINLGNFNVGWSSYSFIVSLTHSLRWYYTYVLCGKTDLLGCSSLLFWGQIPLGLSYLKRFFFLCQFLLLNSFPSTFVNDRMKRKLVPLGLQFRVVF